VDACVDVVLEADKWVRVAVIFRLAVVVGHFDVFLS
jgi:hypothetical protein